jgi:hypothetical protein
MEKRHAREHEPAMRREEHRREHAHRRVEKPMSFEAKLVVAGLALIVVSAAVFIAFPEPLKEVVDKMNGGQPQPNATPTAPTQPTQPQPTQPTQPKEKPWASCPALINGTNTGPAKQCFGIYYDACIMSFLKAGRAAESKQFLADAYYNAALSCATTGGASTTRIQISTYIKNYDACFGAGTACWDRIKSQQGADFVGPMEIDALIKKLESILA